MSALFKQKNKYIAIAMCILIVLTVAGGTVCLWLGNPANTAFFGVFSGLHFCADEPASLSPKNRERLESWMSGSSYTTEKSEQYTPGACFIFAAFFAALMSMGQAVLMAQSTKTEKKYFMRI